MKHEPTRPLRYLFFGFEKQTMGKNKLTDNNGTRFRIQNENEKGQLSFNFHTISGSVVKLKSIGYFDLNKSLDWCRNEVVPCTLCKVWIAIHFGKNNALLILFHVD